MIAPGEIGILSTSDDAGNSTVNFLDGTGVGAVSYTGHVTEKEAESLSRYMFDNDDDIEYVTCSLREWNLDEEQPVTTIVDFGINGPEGHIRYDNTFLFGIVNDSDRAYMVVQRDFYGGIEYIPLAGHNAKSSPSASSPAIRSTSARPSPLMVVWILW